MNLPPQPTEADEAANQNSRVAQHNGETAQCAACKATIVDDHWFCRLPGKEAPTLLCCPSCALRYFERARADRNGCNPDWDSDEHRFHFFVNGEDGDSAEPVE